MFDKNVSNVFLKIFYSALERVEMSLSYVSFSGLLFHIWPFLRKWLIGNLMAAYSMTLLKLISQIPTVNEQEENWHRGQRAETSTHFL